MTMGTEGRAIIRVLLKLERTGSKIRFFSIRKPGLEPFRQRYIFINGDNVEHQHVVPVWKVIVML